MVVAALRGLSFVIERGGRVALVGPNGAGKSPLLRAVAGIDEPVAGRLRVEGEIGSLIDPAAGMEALATGREHIILRGLYRGVTGSEAEAMAEEVVAFADLSEFIDAQIRGYSAGMQVCLAFALATATATAMMPEILLIDKWFLAGDAQCMERAEEHLRERLKTLAGRLRGPFPSLIRCRTCRCNQHRRRPAPFMSEKCPAHPQPPAFPKGP